MASVSMPVEGAGSLTVRQFGQALLLALTAVGVGCGLYVLETWVFRCRHRFIDNPTESMVRAMGLAHFFVGWLYLFSSPGLRSRQGLMRLGGWTMVGGLLCVVYSQAGGSKNPWMLLTFYSLFLVHEVRDQAELFLARGEGPEDRPGREQVLRWLCLAVGWVLLLLLVGGFLVYAWLWRGSSAVLRVPPVILGVGLVFLGLAGLLCGCRFLQVGRQVYGNVRELTASFEPLLMVYFVLAAVLAAGSMLGTVGFNFIVLVHVMTWLVYVQHRLRTVSTAEGWWDWLRRTRAGFLWLHLLAAGGIVLLLALRVHVWERSGFFSELLAGTSFPYWSMMHIVVTFSRRP